MLGIQKQREFLNFNVLPITHGHLRKNHTLKIILHQFETQVSNHQQKHGPQPQIKHSEQKMQSSQNIQQAHISIYSSFNCNLQKYIFQAWPLHTSPSPNPQPSNKLCAVWAQMRWENLCHHKYTSDQLLQYTILHVLKWIYLYSAGTQHRYLHRLVVTKSRVTYFIPWVNMGNCVTKN